MTTKLEYIKRDFEYQMESFLNQWKPTDRFEASQFEAQLFSLVRQIYADAQAPILKQFDHLIMSMPILTSLQMNNKND